MTSTADALETTQLLIRCLGLSISSTAVKKSIFSGLFAQSTPKYDKKIVRLSQSEPFKPGGRPTNFSYRLVFSSESLSEDSVDLTPSLVAVVRRPMDADVKLRLNVYCQRGTGGKDVLLASTTFSFKELLREVSAKGVLRSAMISDYCAEATAYVQIFHELHKPLHLPHFSVVAPPRLNENPLFQRYAFYNQNVAFEPHVLAEEWTMEPRFTAHVAKLYLESLSAALIRSMNAWQVRHDLERKRQGLFSSLDEAFRHGWHSVDICVLASRIGGPSMSSAARSTERKVSASRRPTSTVKDREDHAEILATAYSIAVPAADVPATTWEAGPRCDAIPVTPSFKRKVDDAAPCTFVEVAVLDRSRAFVTPIGRTNTEYFTRSPLYGSNLNAAHAKRAAVLTASASSDAVIVADLSHEFCFLSFDAPERDAFYDVYFRTVHGDSDREYRKAVNSDGDVTESAHELSFAAAVLPPPESTFIVEGKESHFFTYAPSCSDADACFEVFSDDGYVRTRIGSCSAPLSSAAAAGKGSQTLWLPVVTEHPELWGDVELQVRISVQSPSLPLPLQPTVPAEMNEVYLYNRSVRGSLPGIDARDSGAGYDYKKYIADCYEWMWFAGFNGCDPLVINSFSKDFQLASDRSRSSRSCDPHDVTAEGGNDGSQLLSVDEAAPFDEALRESLYCVGSSSNPRVSTLPVLQSDALSDRQEDNDAVRVHKRVDLCYPLDWIQSHMQQMEQLIDELRTSLPFIDAQCKRGLGFRPSTLKKVSEVQALPTNLHYQLMTVKAVQHDSQHDQTNDRSYSSDPRPSDVHVLHSTTCGCMSPHMLGHKDGGLSFLEQNLVQQKVHLERTKDLYIAKLERAGNFAISLAQEQEHGVFKQLSLVKEETLRFESACLSVTHRKLYATSQALSIAVNALLLELALLMEGRILPTTCEQWSEVGFLIVFEGLLSVVNHERSMLEDTMSAVEALRSYQVRLLLLPPEAVQIELQIVGREVLLFLPVDSLSMLPTAFQLAMQQQEGRGGGGQVLFFVPVLFTQGIDLQQTIVSTFGGDHSKSKINPLTLQHDINMKAMKELNGYCHSVKPVTVALINQQQLSGTLSTESAKAKIKSNVHPLMCHLHELILSSSLGDKNVEMLVEAERLCLMLGGSRVTFCKSGKDRTGMASTLEQSRQLGERFGCGMSISRLLRDANIMRVHGCRLMVCEKNIGRKVYSINKLQAQFLPTVFRPPNEVCEDLLKKDNS